MTHLKRSHSAVPRLPGNDRASRSTRRQATGRGLRRRAPSNRRAAAGQGARARSRQRLVSSRSAASWPNRRRPHQITQSISVVERGQIEQTSPTALLDILANVPGVSIARSGGIGGQIYLRGFSSNNFRSPLYIDGDRFRGRNTLQLNWFSPEEIERVEVIRGPASVLYGSEALTGPRQRDHPKPDRKSKRTVSLYRRRMVRGRWQRREVCKHL